MPAVASAAISSWPISAATVIALLNAAAAAMASPCSSTSIGSNVLFWRKLRGFHAKLLFYEFAELLLAGCFLDATDKRHALATVRQLCVLEARYQWDRLDLHLVCDLGRLIYIHFRKDDSAIVAPDDSLEQWGQLLAWAAPFRVTIEQDGGFVLGCDDLLHEICICDVDDVWRGLLSLRCRRRLDCARWPGRQCRAGGAKVPRSANLRDLPRSA